MDVKNKIICSLVTGKALTCMIGAMRDESEEKIQSISEEVFELVCRTFPEKSKVEIIQYIPEAIETLNEITEMFSNDLFNNEKLMEKK